MYTVDRLLCRRSAQDARRRLVDDLVSHTLQSVEESRLTRTGGTPVVVLAHGVDESPARTRPADRRRVMHLLNDAVDDVLDLLVVLGEHLVENHLALLVVQLDADQTLGDLVEALRVCVQLDERAVRLGELRGHRRRVGDGPAMRNVGGERRERQLIHALAAKRHRHDLHGASEVHRCTQDREHLMRVTAVEDIHLHGVRETHDHEALLAALERAGRDVSRTLTAHLLHRGVHEVERLVILEDRVAGRDDAQRLERVVADDDPSVRHLTKAVRRGVFRRRVADVVTGEVDVSSGDREVESALLRGVRRRERTVHDLAELHPRNGALRVLDVLPALRELNALRHLSCPFVCAVLRVRMSGLEPLHSGFVSAQRP